MGYAFPSGEWLAAFCRALNDDEGYARIARSWEGDLNFVIELDSNSPDMSGPVLLYMDLWHGACRGIRYLNGPAEPAPKARFTLRAPLGNFRRILAGELDPMQAMLTRKLRVEGDMIYIMRNVPVVLDFVRCARAVEIDN